MADNSGLSTIACITQDRAYRQVPTSKIPKYMEEPGEQCTVVFALIVTERASECVGVEGGRHATAPSSHSKILEHVFASHQPVA
jgi:hypothetical protein